MFQWTSILSRLALEQNKMLPIIRVLLETDNKVELRSLTGFVRNLSRHAKDKNIMGEASILNYRTSVHRISLAVEKIIVLCLSF